MTQVSAGTFVYQRSPSGRVVKSVVATVVVAGVLWSAAGTSNSLMPVPHTRCLGLGIGLPATSSGSIITDHNDAYPIQTATISEQLRTLKGDSGLTWEQIAKLFGVSRRSVHLWVGGNRMNAGHEETLASLLDVVNGLPSGSVEARRMAMLRPRPGGPSIYDQFRMDRADVEVLEESSFAHVHKEGST